MSLLETRKVRKPLVANRCFFSCLKSLLGFIDHWNLNESESTEGTKWTNGLKVKVSDSFDNVPNENVVTQLVTDQPTNRQTNKLTNCLNC